ncbi:MOSC domain-containing protein [Dongia rigui]|uniref:MOSC domain-containing protein n=1 Tax=Dongia rigui TaxID=940149 RepID=A0ABU5DV29_9PROT|nr:MOSC domain-containing protein [Dongia rigui]MDY0871155.1 MOSC domain-containing protein [Dongia rigui]
MSDHPRVIGVSLARGHHFSKQPALEIRLLTGLGVAGDAHMGETVKHRSRVAKDPTQPNLRQVHLIQSELFDELAARGFNVQPGDMGENIATRGIDLLRLPEAARLEIGGEAIVEITGLRNPCVQIDRFQQGLMQAVLDRDADGALIRKAGVMAVVIRGGDIRVGDPIRMRLPEGPARPLKPV